MIMINIDFFHGSDWLKTWTLHDNLSIIYPHIGEAMIINNIRYCVVDITWNDVINPFRIKVDLIKN